MKRFEGYQFITTDKVNGKQTVEKETIRERFPHPHEMVREGEDYKVFLPKAHFEQLMRDIDDLPKE